MTAALQRIDTDSVPAATQRLYRTASAIAISGNIVLLATKGIVARLSGSSAIYADAANSASDVAYSLLMAVGLWLALRPADANHPHGHRRIEPLVSLFIGAMMVLAGIEALRHGYTSWRGGPEAITSLWALLTPVGVVGIKALMFWSTRSLGRRANSPALLAAARDNLSDVVSSATALLGVAASRWLFPAADPLAALLVAVWILRAAWEVLREGVRHLIGGAGDPEITRHVLETARAVPGVLGVHQVIVEHCGPQVRADIHINMPGAAPLDEVHRVSDAVRAAVEALDDVEHAFIHVEPPHSE